MKSLHKSSRSSSNERVPFSHLEDGLIECQGIILKRLNKRIKNKKIVIEYYKCQNSFCRSKNTGPCKFSGKLIYYLRTQPKYLEIIKQHSSFCLNNEGNRIYVDQPNKKGKEKKGYQILPLDGQIYTNKVPVVDISIQIKKEDNLNVSGNNESRVIGK